MTSVSETRDAPMDRLALHGGRPIRERPFPERVLFDEEAERLVVRTLRSGWLYGPGGPMTASLERRFAALYGSAHAVACSSGTAAIHLALAALDFEPGSEIVTAPITDAGTIIPIIYQHGIPVFADIDEHYGMDPADLERKITDRTAAILVVHLFGSGSDMREIRKVADRHGIPVLEDCSQAHVTQLDGHYLGRWGQIGAFSLQQAKHMTTGDGGVVITDDEGSAERMRLFRDKGWERGRHGARSYPVLGLNYRMTELQAAVGVPQISRVRTIVERRGNLGARLAGRLAAVDGVRPHTPVPGCEHSYWLFAFEVDGWDTPEFAKALGAEGVPAAPGYTGKPIYECMSALAERRTFGSSGYPFSGRDGHPAVTYRPGLCPAAEEALRRQITVWPNEAFSEEDIDDLAAAVEKVAALLPRSLSFR